MGSIEQVRARLTEGLVIPACPLALTARRRLDERRQRALFRYYLAAGAGGLAVGVHTTQFAIRDPKVGLFGPVLALAAEALRRYRPAPQAAKALLPARPLAHSHHPRADLARTIAERDQTSVAPVAIAGLCGKTRQALHEANLVRDLGYDAGLLSLGAMKHASEDELIAHCAAVAEIIPLFGFYLQPAVGGRALPYPFWRRFAEIQNVVAIKIAPFNRYYTLDVVRAVIESGREDIALYTGNDDNIVLDLLTPFRFTVKGEVRERRVVGGLLGHWAVWTRKAVELHAECQRVAMSATPVPPELLRTAVAVTDCNAAFFDAAHNFAGCIPGLHEVLRRQGLLKGIWCLDPTETLSPGQREEIERVYRAYPELNDDTFVAEHRDEWLC